MFQTAITARLSTFAVNIYPLSAPLNFVAPAVVYTQVGTDPAEDLDGSPTQSWTMYQIDVYDPSLRNATMLAKTIRDNFATWSDDQVSGVTLQAERQWVDDVTNTRLYRISTDYKFFGAF